MSRGGREPVSAAVGEFLFARLHLGRGSAIWISTATAIALGLLLAFVDLSPRVESDFFFSPTDSALQSTQAIEALFPTRPQVLVGVAAEDVLEEETLELVGRLSDGLAALDGVGRVLSLTRGPPTPNAVLESELWRQVLMPSGRGWTLLVALPSAPEWRREDLEAIERLIAGERAEGQNVVFSGAPWIVELIRRRLGRDLRVFTLAAVAVLGLLAAALFRSIRLATGALVACGAACVATLGLLAAFRVPIGVLTANLGAIVFVLTLSHLVFLTGGWQRTGDVDRALSETFEPSFWAALTTLAGFGSLLLAAAKPMRELGVAGLVGTTAALLSAYGIFAPFLRRERVRARPEADRSLAAGSPRELAVALLVLLAFLAPAGLGLIHDPPLLSYFAEGSELREGLETVDRAGGSTSLQFVVRRDDGGRFDDEDGIGRLAAAGRLLGEDAETGTVLSAALLVAEGRRLPLTAWLPIPQLLELLASPRYGEIARGFLTEDRSRALLTTRMHEGERREPRLAVQERLRQVIEAEGLEVELVGGLYFLEGAIGRLVSRSLLTGLLGLLALFLCIAVWISRSLRTTAVMVGSLLAVTIGLLGAIGRLSFPLDLIASPAANVAIAVGVDTMIHLVLRVRRLNGDWETARRDLRRPVLTTALLLGCGFGLFGLSSFPPTRRFGIAVLIGTALAAAATLSLLPAWAGGRKEPSGSTLRP